LRTLIASQNTENPSLLPEAIVFHNFFKKYVCFKFWKYAKAVNPSQSFSPNAGKNHGKSGGCVSTVGILRVRERFTEQRNDLHKKSEPLFVHNKQTIIHSPN